MALNMQDFSMFGEHQGNTQTYCDSASGVSSAHNSPPPNGPWWAGAASRTDQSPACAH